MDHTSLSTEVYYPLKYQTVVLPILIV